MASSSKISICASLISHFLDYEEYKTYEKTTDDLSLLLGVNDTSKRVEETIGSVNNSEGDTQMLSKCLLDLLALIKTHHTIVDKLS